MVVGGLITHMQQPGTASGVIFITLEDETGVSNVIVWPKVYERFRRAVIGGRLLRVSGQLQREGIVTHLIADTVEDLSPMLAELGHPMDEAVGRTDPRADAAPRRKTAANLQPRARHPRERVGHAFGGRRLPTHERGPIEPGEPACRGRRGGG